MGKTKIFAGEEAAVVIPVILEVIEVQVALRAIPIEARDAVVAIRVHPDRNVQNIVYATAR